MKLIVEKAEGILKKVKAEYTPAEALVLNDALHRYAEDRKVNVSDRLIAQHMLSLVPVEEEEGED